MKYSYGSIGLAILRPPHALDVGTGRHARDRRRAAERSDPGA